MQIVIPMSGLGSRFVQAGYTAPKPLIHVHGKPIIEWVLHMFPGEHDVLFICRDEHLQNSDMKQVLTQLCPSGRILSIEGHKKGPVWALKQAMSDINLLAPVMVSYCDYYMRWDWPAFKQYLQDKDPAGAIPCYTGFHPHLRPKHNVYASCLTDDADNLIEIREKHSFEANKEKAKHSPGVYYVKSGAILAKYVDIMIEEDIALNGEYYASLMYNPMVKDGLTVKVPVNVHHFCQWGTPEDLESFLFWTSIVKGFRNV
jgi:NDP-sugar pyrophosphorylase family protein